MNTRIMIVPIKLLNALWQAQIMINKVTIILEI